MWLKAVSDEDDFEALEGICCLRKVLWGRNVLHGVFMDADH
jgi:hypothetical protein